MPFNSKHSTFAFLFKCTLQSKSGYPAAVEFYLNVICIAYFSLVQAVFRELLIARIFSRLGVISWVRGGIDTVNAYLKMIGSKCQY
jgi:hypothetical protein